MSVKRSAQRAQSRFAQIPSVNVPRSMFDRTHTMKTTFNAGLLVPILVDEVLPGDTFNVRLTHFARLATPRTAIFDNLVMDFFFFFVPNRLLWDKWQRFMGEQENPGDSTDFLVPKVSNPGAGGFEELSLADYFGIPTKVPNIAPNALHFRAYNLIYNEWFRDQNLQQRQPVPKDDGPDDPTSYKVLRRGKRHDYFTSALPFPQKGDQVTLPLTGNAPIVPSFASVLPTGDMQPEFFTDVAFKLEKEVGDNIRSEVGVSAANGVLSWNDAKLGVNMAGFTADLSQVTAATINQLREASRVQALLERDARSGTRYTELVRGHFGVVSPDARLQRPEYLGGGRSTVGINPVPQTSAADAQPTPQGNIAAFGTSAGQAGFVKSFTEHGVILGLVCVRADLHYQQGLHKMWTRQTRVEFGWPEFMHLGEQAVLSGEIFADGSAQDTEEVWGYQERYSEYRYKPSHITGLMRSNAAQPLDVWHLAQEFGARPQLDATFIEENPPVDRVLAVPSEPHILFDGICRLIAARPMPTYSVPGIRRF